MESLILGCLCIVWGICKDFWGAFYVSQGRAVRFPVRKHTAPGAETYVSGLGSVETGEGFPHDF